VIKGEAKIAIEEIMSKGMAQAAQKTKLLLPLREQRWNLRII